MPRQLQHALTLVAALTPWILLSIAMIPSLLGDHLHPVLLHVH